MPRQESKYPGQADHLFTNAQVATMAANGAYGLIEDGAVAVANERICWAGRAQDAPASLAATDCGGRLITPGLVDCHTHLVFAGNRSHEFEARLLGKSYEEIAREGGGIISTVNATRAASEENLLNGALARIDRAIANGVTTIEIKSGYGLDLDTELKMLRVARALGELRPIRIKTTFLGAHALPPEYAGRADDYIDFVCEEVLPAIHKNELADAVDGFCENIGFTPSQIERVFKTAARLGLPVKLHAEQLSECGGARLASKYNALSADHLEYLRPGDAKLMAQSGVSAVLLPGAFYFLGEEKAPPVDALRAAGVSMAVATDCNPGSSPMTSLLVALNMACVLFRLTPEEALSGVTRNGAKALGGGGEYGTIEIGKSADIIIWDAEHPAELAYNIGGPPLFKRIFKGQP